MLRSAPRKRTRVRAAAACALALAGTAVVAVTLALSRMPAGEAGLAAGVRARVLPTSPLRTVSFPRASSIGGTKTAIYSAVASDLGTIGFSEPDQKLRHKLAVENNNRRVLDIDSVYQGEKLKGKTVVVTGANRGLGAQIAKELMRVGAKVIGTSRSSMPDDCQYYKTVEGIDVQSDAAMEKLVNDLKGEKIDILINNAGYFLKDPETIDNLNFPEEIKMIDICALGPLRVSSAIVNAGLMESGGKIIHITSQGGSVEWRSVQNANGPSDYGHHMSKCAANMMGKLMAVEMKEKGIMVVMLHPGFNKTTMTEKYKHIWEEEGAVDPEIGAKRVCHEIAELTPDTAGRFVNCEDGKDIPW